MSDLHNDRRMEAEAERIAEELAAQGDMPTYLVNTKSRTEYIQAPSAMSAIMGMLKDEGSLDNNINIISTGNSHGLLIKARLADQRTIEITAQLVPD